MKSCRKLFLLIIFNTRALPKFAKPFIYGALILALLLILPVSQVFAAKIEVDASCNLDQAINSANNNRNNNNEYGNCEVGDDQNDGGDTIAITRYGATNDTITLSAALPRITSKITIEGGGFTIDGAEKYRVFYVDHSGNLTIKSVTITKGKANGGGGAIWNYGILTIIDSTFKENEVAGSGGAILNWDDLFIENSIFSNNKAIDETGSTPNYGRGGAIHNIGTTTIDDSIFKENTATERAGAIYTDLGSVTINNSSIVNNSTDGWGGGGLRHFAGELFITNSTIANNRATGNTPNTTARGGGLDINNGIPNSSVKLTHVTIVNNYAKGQGGGIFIDPNLSIVEDKVIINSILANNTSDAAGNDCHGTLGTNVGNLIKDSSDCGTGAVSGDPKLGSLIGSPAYYPLQAGSPAIDAAADDHCTMTDQLGQIRPATDCDIGAFEVNPATPTPTPTPPSTTAPCVCEGAGESTSTRLGADQAQLPAPTCPPLLPGIDVTDLTRATECLRIDAEGIGIQSVIERGIVDAVDVWGFIGAGTRVCFLASGGSFSFLDAATAPRTVRSLPLHLIDGKTCTFINSPGSVVLHPGVGVPQPVPVSQPVEVESSPQNWENCQVVTTDALNLRESADGEIMTGLAAGITLDVVSQVDGWVEVDFYGRSGWVSAEYVRLTGECG